MIDFVGTLSFLRIALWVAMEIMHLYLTRIRLFLEHKKVMYSLGLDEQYATHEKLSWGGRQGMSY